MEADVPALVNQVAHRLLMTDASIKKNSWTQQLLTSHNYESQDPCKCQWRRLGMFLASCQPTPAWQVSQHLEGILIPPDVITLRAARTLASAPEGPQQATATLTPRSQTWSCSTVTSHMRQLMSQ